MQLRRAAEENLPEQVADWAQDARDRGRSGVAKRRDVIARDTESLVRGIDRISRDGARRFIGVAKRRQAFPGRSSAPALLPSLRDSCAGRVQKPPGTCVPGSRVPSLRDS